MRKVFGYVVIVTLIVIATTSAASAQSPGSSLQNEIEVRGQVGFPSGEANFSNTNDSNQNIDFARDFNFDGKLGFDVRFAHRSENKKHKFVFEYGRDSWDQERTLTRSFIFLGQTYVANANADLDITVRSFWAKYAYRWGNEKVRFGPMANLGVIWTDVTLTGTTNNGARTSDGSITKFSATIGYDLEATPSDKIMLFHNLGAIVFQGEHLFHTEGGIKVFPSRHFGIVGGYRFYRYKVEDNDNFVTVKAHGPFFGGLVRF